MRRSTSIAVAVTLTLLTSARVHAQEPAGAGLSLREAVQVTLAEQPQIHVSREQVVFSEGTLQAVSGQFDVRLGASVDRSRISSPLRDIDRQALNLPDVLTNTTQFNVGLEKLLRSGLSASVSVGMIRQDISVDPPATNRSTLSLSLSQPLLRGRGADVVTAEEDAARFGVSASSQDLRHTAAFGVLRTALAYWTYVASAQNVEVIAAAEERARTLLDETQVLVDAGNRPAADLKQVQGNLAERIALRAQVEQALFSARQDLGLAMGLPADRINALPLPADTFPAIADVVPLTVSPVLFSTALASRADLEAARYRERGNEVLIGAALDDLEPQVDLNFNLGFTGLAEGVGFSPYFTAFERRMTGPNATAALVYSWPTANNSARGLLARTEATHRQTLLQIDDLTRTIRSNIAVAQGDLARSAERVRALGEAAGLYRSAVDDEQQKLRLGLSTIIDLVLIEDRLMRSLIDQIAARQSYAQALARLRFETGTLVGGEAPVFQVAPDVLTTVPVTTGTDH